MEYVSFLAPQIEEFIRFRKASMRWNHAYSADMHMFDNYCIKKYPNAIDLSDEMISGWCKKKDTETRNSCRARIYCVIGFVNYLNDYHGANLTAIEPPKREPRNYVPHAFTKDELIRFFKECDCRNINGGFPILDRRRKNLTIPVIYRVLYSTGMRPIEVRMLKRTDVNLESGVVGITVSKGYDQRYIVLHDSMLALMIQYDQLISEICPNRTYFFPGDKDGYITKSWLNNWFRILWAKTSEARCRPYDFRHNYAIQNINNWLSAGLSYHPKLVYLSKSMGHRDIEGTRYYYSLVPIMAEILEQQGGMSFDELIPEVQSEKSV